MERHLRVALSGVCLVVMLISFQLSRDRSITLDESTTLYWSYQAFHHQPSALLMEIHTPSYDVVSGLWFLLVGFGATQASMFSALMAVLSVVFTFGLVNREFGAKVAIFSVLLLAASPVTLFFAQYARAYSFFIAASVASSFFYLRLNGSLRSRNTWGYLLATYLLIGSHIAAFALPLVQWLHLLVPAVRKGNRGRVVFWFRLQAVLAVFYLPILGIIPSRYNLVQDIPSIYSWVPKPTTLDLLAIFRYFSGAQRELTVILAGLVAYAGWVFFKGRANRSSSVECSTVSYLLLWLFVPPMLLFTLSHLFHPLFIPRGLAHGVVPWLALCSAALARIAQQRWVGVVLLVVILGLSGWAVRQRQFGEYEEWRDATRVVAEASAQPVVLVYPEYAALPFAFYFKPGCFYSDHYRDCLSRNKIYPIADFKQIQDFTYDGASHVWFFGYTVAKREADDLLLRMKQLPQLRFLESRSEFQGIELSSFQLVNRSERK